MAPAPHDKGPLLGRQVPGSEQYDPGLLFPVPRSNARSSLPGGTFSGFGEDVWHAYELSWLDGNGMPRSYVGVITVPATSANLIESKSLKLYLNSLNNHRFESRAAAVECICRDLSAVAGAQVGLAIDTPDGGLLEPRTLDSAALDSLSISVPEAPDRALLSATACDDHVHLHGLRSLCPVTAQPDWATIIIETRGRSAEREGLLAYLLAYRNHQEFHEQCVERIFVDLQACIAPDYLSVHALYTRRGGLDISPWRSSTAGPAPRWRLQRQ